MEGKAIDERAAAAGRPGWWRRLGKRHRQLHGLSLRVGERVGLFVDRVAVATREQVADLAHDARGDLLDVLVGGRRHWRKFDPAALVANLAPGRLALYLDCGTEDEFLFHNQAAYIHDLLNEKKIPHTYYLGSGNHSFPSGASACRRA